MAVVAAGTLLQDKLTTILDVPSQLNAAFDPIPVPNVNVLTELATGKNPLSANVPAYTCSNPVLIKLELGATASFVWPILTKKPW